MTEEKRINMTESEMLSVGIAWTLCMCLAGAYLCYQSYSTGLKRSRIEAVETGHAVWKVSADSSTEFSWKPQQ